MRIQIQANRKIIYKLICKIEHPCAITNKLTRTMNEIIRSVTINYS